MNVRAPTPNFGARVLVLASFVLAVGCFEHPRFGPEIENYGSNANPVIPDDCVSSAPQGVSDFRDMALATYPFSRDLGILRGCYADGFWRSKHKAGRAFDWGLNVNDGVEKILADRFIGWLLIPSEHFGHPHEMARRLGIVELIWNSRIWTTSQSPEFSGNDYGGESPHEDHIHIGFHHGGAIGFSTFWLPQASCDQSVGWYWDGSNCSLDFGL